MIDGLLQPRADEPHPWLMPIMRASRGALHGDRKRLYPRKTIWVDSGADPGGDGSVSRPLNSLDMVLADETLECVCRALCCDKLTVRVKGPVSVTTNDTISTSASDVVTVVDGHGRDYARHLVIRPWDNAGRLELKATLRAHVTVSETNQVEFSQYATIVRALRGVMWVNTDAIIDLVIVCDRDPEDIRINAMAELGGWDDCADSILMHCTVTVRTRVDVLMKTPYNGDYPAPGGGGGGSGGGGSGGGGGGGSGSYPWPGTPGTPPIGNYPYPVAPSPGTPPVMPWGGQWNAATLVFGVRHSAGLIVRGGRLDLVALAYSNWGALAECRGIVNCPDSDLAGMTIQPKALADASGSGAEYENQDGSRGVADYQLVAVARAQDVAQCHDSGLTSLLGESLALATTTAVNQPHRIAADGTRTNGAVAGFAQAEDYGLLGCRNAKAAALVHNVLARASHPTHYGQRACPFAGNAGTVFDSCSGRGAQCRSNRAGWCHDAGACDAV